MPTAPKSHTLAGETIEPGRLATPEEANRAGNDAIRLLHGIRPLNLKNAAAYVRRTCPSAEAVAFLAFIAHDLFARENQSRAGRAPRSNSLRDQLRKAGVTKYKEIAQKAPALLVNHTKRQLTDAISKARRGLKSP